MALRSETSKPRPGPIRDLLRVAARAMVLISSVVALCDVAGHVWRPQAPDYTPLASTYDEYPEHELPEHYHESDHYSNYHDEYPEHYHESGYDYDHNPYEIDDHDLAVEPFVVRWTTSLFPGEDELKGAVGEVLGVDAALLKIESTVHEHQLVLLSFQGDQSLRPAPRDKWQDWLEDKAEAKLHGLADALFPTHLAKALCDKLGGDDDKIGGDTEELAHAEASFNDKVTQAAYEAGCREWEKLPELYYGYSHYHGYHHHGYDVGSEDRHDHEHGYWDQDGYDGEESDDQDTEPSGTMQGAEDITGENTVSEVPAGEDVASDASIEDKIASDASEEDAEALNAAVAS